MKRTLALIISLALIITTVFAGGATEANPGVPLIGVSKLMAHPALDAVEKGMQDYLASAGMEVRYDLQNAQGDISTASTIAQQFKTNGCDVVLGIATPTAQALANVFTDVPVVFAAVTDAVEAGLVDSDSGNPESNICGVSDKNPVDEQIKLLMEVTGAKTIGNIYASGEANGVILMEQAKAAVENNGGKFVEVAVSNTAEVKMAAQSIIDRVDAIYIATDNTVVSALAAVDEVCAKAGKPLFSSDPSGVDGLECLIAWGFNYYSLGLETGKVIEKILKGENAGSIGTVYLTDPSDFELWFNLDTAKKLGVTIPEDLLANAAVIIENGEKITK